MGTSEGIVSETTEMLSFLSRWFYEASSEQGQALPSVICGCSTLFFLNQWPACPLPAVWNSPHSRQQYFCLMNSCPFPKTQLRSFSFELFPVSPGRIIFYSVHIIRESANLSDPGKTVEGQEAKAHPSPHFLWHAAWCLCQQTTPHGPYTARLTFYTHSFVRTQ